MNTYKLLSLLIIGISLLQVIQPHYCGVDLEDPIPVQNQQTPSDNNRRVLQSSVYEPIRITFDTSKIEDMPEFQKSQILKQLEIAKKYFAKILKVKRIIGNNINGGMRPPMFFNPGPEYTIGIPDSDVHILLNYINQDRTFVAAANSSYQQNSDQRPTMGSITFNLAYYTEADLRNNFEFEGLLKTTIHEITHILAFNSKLYASFRNPETGQVYDKVTEEHTYGGRTNHYIITPKVQQMAREHFQCSTQPGMPLEGTTVSSHWEKNGIENEYMLAASVDHEVIFSKFTLALFEDSGWYQVSYDFADPAYWGKDKGCGFIETCDPAVFPEYKENHGTTCNYLHTGAQIFTDVQNTRYAGNCNIGRTLVQRLCIDDNNQSDSVNQNAISNGGEVYSVNSRCFESSVGVEGFSYNNVRCHEFECVEEGSSVGINVILKGEKYAIDKTTNKVTIAPKGLNSDLVGEVNGPENWEMFCDKHTTPCKNYCSQNGICVNNQCLCHSDFAGEDCSISCPGNSFVDNNGNCLNSNTCPGNTIKQNLDSKICELCPGGTFYYENQCISNCPSGSFRDGVVCKSCAEGCEECQNLNSCQSCKSTYFKVFIGEVGGAFTCESDCPAKHFQDANQTCSKCHDSCLSCLREDTCETCDEGMELDGNSQYCIIQCMDGCASCTQADVCQECEIGFFKHENSCVQECPSDHFKDTENKICKRCSDNCLSCSSLEQCSQCGSDYFEKDGVCLECGLNCDQCILSSDNCQNCKAGKFQYTTTANQLQCLDVCPEGYSNQDSICVENQDNTTDPGQDNGNTDNGDNNNTDNGSTDPDNGGSTDPNNGDNTDPNNGGNTDPTNGGNTDPTNGGNTDPTNGDNTDPTNGGNTDPNNGDNTDPNNGGNTDPNNGDNTDPNNGGNTDPNNGDNTDTNNGDNTDANNGGNTDTNNGGNTDTNNGGNTNTNNGDNTDTSNGDNTNPDNGDNTDTNNGDNTNPDNGDNTNTDNGNSTDPDNGSTDNNNGDSTDTGNDNNNNGNTDGDEVDDSTLVDTGKIIQDQDSLQDKILIGDQNGNDQREGRTSFGVRNAVDGSVCFVIFNLMLFVLL